MRMCVGRLTGKPLIPECFGLFFEEDSWVMKQHVAHLHNQDKKTGAYIGLSTSSFKQDWNGACRAASDPLFTCETLSSFTVRNTSIFSSGLMFEAMRGDACGACTNKKEIICSTRLTGGGTCYSAGVGIKPTGTWLVETSEYVVSIHTLHGAVLTTAGIVWCTLILRTDTQLFHLTKEVLIGWRLFIHLYKSLIRLNQEVAGRSSVLKPNLGCLILTASNAMETNYVIIWF